MKAQLAPPLGRACDEGHRTPASRSMRHALSVMGRASVANNAYNVNPHCRGAGSGFATATVLSIGVFAEEFGFKIDAFSLCNALASACFAAFAPEPFRGCSWWLGSTKLSVPLTLTPTMRKASQSEARHPHK